MLVSCIMPTRGRSKFAAAAVEQWRAQTHTPLELVIVDDRDNPSFPHGIIGAGIQYHAMRTRLTIGAKRNIACSRANGQVIAHLDDDDVSAPRRIADQLALMLESGKSVVGYRSLKFTDGVNWWLYTGAPDYALGTSLMYRREWWEQRPFSSGQESGEDSMFIAPARGTSNQIAVKDAGDMLYASIHPGNTSKRDMSNPIQWRKL